MVNSAPRRFPTPKNRRKIRGFLPVLLAGCLLLPPSLSTAQTTAQQKAAARQKQAIEHYTHDLESPNVEIRATAAYQLGNIGPAAASAGPALVPHINDTDRDVRRITAYALGSISPASDSVVSALASLLKNKDKILRTEAADALRKIGTAPPSAIPTLSAALHVEDAYARAAVVEALGSMGTAASSAVPELIKALADEDSNVRYSAITALGKMRRVAEKAVPALTANLKDKDPAIRRAAADVLGSMGEVAQDAVPSLIAAIRDPNRDVSDYAADAVTRIGDAPRSDIHNLTQELKDKNSSVRAAAAYVLGKMEDIPDSVVQTLVQTPMRTNDSSDSSFRASAARILGNKGATAVPAVRLLADLLSDPDINVGRSAANALNKIAHAVKIAPGDVNSASAIRDFNAAQETLQRLPQNAWKDPAQLEALRTNVGQAAEALIKAKYFRWMSTRPAQILFLVLLWAVFWLMVNILLLRLRPSALFRINDSLQRRLDMRIGGLMLPFSLILRLPTEFFFFHYHPLVLDAWIYRHARIVRERLREIRTFKESAVYVDLPVLWRGESRRIGPAELQKVFDAESAALLVWGEGGSGKTTLICQVAFWALAENPAERLCQAHPMLPIFIEENIAADERSDRALLMDTLQKRIQHLTGQDAASSSALTQRLLQSRRLLLIVDSFSELDEATRRLFLPESAPIPLPALALTSRVVEPLRAAKTEIVQTSLMQWNQVSAFLWEYLGRRGKRDIFTGGEIGREMSRLYALVGQRKITALLARLYAQFMIDAKEQTFAEHPRSIPELMDAYVNELCRKTEGGPYGRRVIHEIARIIAWECLRTTFTPMEALYSDVERTLASPPETPTLRLAWNDPDAAVVAESEEVVQALAARREKRRTRPYQSDPHAAIEYFIEKLRLLQRRGMDGGRLKFSLDPPSEYLAARYLVVSLYGEDEALWNAFFAEAEAKSGAPQSIAGFLSAVRDTWDTFGAEGPFKSHLLAEMQRRFGAVLPGAPAPEASVSVALWVSLLSSRHKEDYLLALEELKNLGEAARDAVPDLRNMLTHTDLEARERSGKLLERLEANVHAAVSS